MSPGPTPNPRPGMAHPCHYPEGPALPGSPASTPCLAQVPQLTQTRRAGMGVQCLTWIMASRLGRCPSRAPEKHSLALGTEMGTGHILGLSFGPDVPLKLSPLTSCSGPSSPTGQFSPSSSLPPSCFLCLPVVIRHLLPCGIIIPASGRPLPLAGVPSSGPRHDWRTPAPQPSLPMPTSPQCSHLE